MKKEENNNKRGKIKNFKNKQSIKQSIFRIKEVLFLIFITCIISLSVGVFLHYKLADNTVEVKNISIDIGPEIEEFVENYNYIINNYYDEIDKDELIESAIKGMIDSLDDPHSMYMDEADGSTFNILLDGSYEGVGIQISDSLNGDIVIIKVFEDSPAAKAGLQEFDIITKIDNTSLEGKKATDLTNYIKNSKTNNFEITFIQDDKEHVINLNKEIVSIKSVFSETYRKNDKIIGYLKVDIFAANTDQQFQEELKRLEILGVDSLIIDLRNNSGGHLNTVENMISLFLDTSHVIYQTQVKDVIEKHYSKGAVTKQYPIVILSNTSSASASEVMMGALQDEYGAIIIGESSYGKGTVQELKTVSTGGQYKVTTKKWLTPSGFWVEDVGIKPNEEIKLSDEYYEEPTKENDNQLQRAINILS